MRELRTRFADRTLLAKMARWDPDKRWLGALEIVVGQWPDSKCRLYEKR